MTTKKEKNKGYQFHFVLNLLSIVWCVSSEVDWQRDLEAIQPIGCSIYNNTSFIPA